MTDFLEKFQFGCAMVSGAMFGNYYFVTSPLESGIFWAVIFFLMTVINTVRYVRREGFKS
jgi:cell shape-determining protein MreD